MIAEGFNVDVVRNGEDGLWSATENAYDVVILDIMLPKLNGYKVVERMRMSDNWTPVLMLTAKDGEYDQTDAFDLGADDYLTKPLSFIVLVARLRALIRRGAPARPTILSAGDLTLDPARRVTEQRNWYAHVTEDGVDDIDTSVLQSSGGSQPHIEVSDAAGFVVFHTDPDEPLPNSLGVPRTGGTLTYYDVEVDDDIFVVSAVGVLDDEVDEYAVRSALPTDSVTASTTILITLLSLGTPLIALLVALSTYWLVGRALAPVEAIRSRVASISSANDSARVPVPNSGDEVARLAETMNSMLPRLEASAAAQSRFVSDASNELRSPLASMRMTTELATQHPDAMPWQEASESVLAETIRLQALVSDLLLLTNSDEGHLRSQPTDVDLDDLVQQEANRLRREGRSNVVLDVQPVRVVGDPHHLIRAIRNLADNADRHAASTVELRLAHDHNAAYLDVIDDGAGIPEDQRDRIFDRFVRLDGIAVIARSEGESGAHFRLTIPLP